MMLGRLMNAGLLSQARQLASIFEHDSPDLTIVLVRVFCAYDLCQLYVSSAQLSSCLFYSAFMLLQYYI